MSRTVRLETSKIYANTNVGQDQRVSVVLNITLRRTPGRLFKSIDSLAQSVKVSDSVVL